MLRNLFRSRPGLTPAEGLYAQAADQARRPAFYVQLGVADQIDARFELYTLHVLLLIMRLRAEGEDAAHLGQGVFDVYVSALDNTLRELGVGDISVGKKMRKLGESLYGRMKAYEVALEAGDRTALAEALARNVYAQAAPTPDADALAVYALAARSALAAQAFDDLLREPAWPEVAR